MGSAPRLPPVISTVNGEICSLRGTAKNSARTGQPVTTAFSPRRRGSFSMGHGHSSGHTREHPVGEPRLDVGLKNDTGNPVHHGEKHHRARRVAPYSKSGIKPVPMKDSLGIPETSRKHSQISQQFPAANALSGQPLESIPAAGPPAAQALLLSRVRFRPAQRFFLLQDFLPGIPACHRTAPRRSHSRAMAMAGNTWPPVPPPAISKAIPLGRQRIASRLVRVLADVQEHARCQQHSEQAGPAIADERQRNSLCGHEPENDAQIDHRLPDDHRRNADPEQPPEIIGGLHGRYQPRQP